MPMRTPSTVAMSTTIQCNGIISGFSDHLSGPFPRMTGLSATVQKKDHWVLLPSKSGSGKPNAIKPTKLQFGHGLPPSRLQPMFPRLIESRTPAFCHDLSDTSIIIHAFALKPLPDLVGLFTIVRSWPVNRNKVAPVKPHRPHGSCDG